MESQKTCLVLSNFSSGNHAAYEIMWKKYGTPEKDWIISFGTRLFSQWPSPHIVNIYIPQSLLLMIAFVLSAKLSKKNATLRANVNHFIKHISNQLRMIN